MFHCIGSTLILSLRSSISLGTRGEFHLQIYWMFYPGNDFSKFFSRRNSVISWKKFRNDHQQVRKWLRMLMN